MGRGLLTHRCQTDDHSIERISELNLTAQTALFLDVKGLIEHVLFIVRLLGHCPGMCTLHIAMAAGTHGHATAGALHGQLRTLAELHDVHVHVGGRFQLVGSSFSVNDGNANGRHDQNPLTPLTVVYLSTRFLSG